MTAVRRRHGRRDPRRFCATGTVEMVTGRLPAVDVLDVLARAAEIQRYLVQPFPIAEPVTGVPGLVRPGGRSRRRPGAAARPDDQVVSGESLGLTESQSRRDREAEAIRLLR